MLIKVESFGINEAQARLRGLAEKKIKTATVSALNVAARSGYEAVRREISRVFDRPTPWVLGGVQYTKAVREAEMIAGYAVGEASIMTATIDLDKWGNKQGVSVDQVLRAQIAGGQRRPKRHEVALRALLAMPADMLAVPGSAAKMDQYGNMIGGQIRQIQSFFRAAEMFAGVTANSTAKTRAKLAKDNKRTGARGFQYFALQQRKGKLPPGIYQRFTTGFGSAIKPVIIFIKQASYQRRFDFYGVGVKAAREKFNESIDRYLAQMLRERGL